MTAEGNVDGSVAAGSDSRVWELASTTTPAVPERFMPVLAASGVIVAAVVGLDVTAPPARKCPPAGSRIEGRSTLLLAAVPVAERYWTDLPAREIAEPVGL